MIDGVAYEVEQRLRDDPAVAASLPGLEAEVAAGTTSPSVAATRLLDLLGS